MLYPRNDSLLFGANKSRSFSHSRLSIRLAISDISQIQVQTNFGSRQIHCQVITIFDIVSYYIITQTERNAMSKYGFQNALSWYTNWITNCHRFFSFFRLFDVWREPRNPKLDLYDGIVCRYFTYFSDDMAFYCGQSVPVCNLLWFELRGSAAAFTYEDNAAGNGWPEQIPDLLVSGEYQLFLLGEVEQRTFQFFKSVKLEFHCVNFMRETRDVVSELDLWIKYGARCLECLIGEWCEWQPDKCILSSVSVLFQS